MFYSWLSVGIAIVNKESFKNSWIRTAIPIREPRIQEPWMRIMIRIDTKV